jgi:SAM-dependent methyltransferase
MSVARILYNEYQEECMSSSCFYEEHCQDYAATTCGIDPSPFLTLLTKRLKPRATILDVGCGAGRDLLWMKEKGYQMTGLERSVGLAEIARELSGCSVIMGNFRKFDFSGFSFDGTLLIGALVHVEHRKMEQVLQNISKGVKNNGFILLTLKEGRGQKTSPDGRIFMLWQQNTLEQIFRNISFTVEAFFTNKSEINTNEVWLNYLLTTGKES